MILVFGSLNMDLLFRAERLPMPGETVLCPGYEAQAGGKGMNQAVAAARAGGTVRMAGAIGSDGFGDTLLTVLRAEGIGTDGIARVAQPTGCASVAIDSEGRNSIVVGSGANRAARHTQVRDSDLRPGTTLVLQMEVPPAETAALLARARERGARTLLNLAPFAPLDRGVLALVDILVVNEIEVAQLARHLGIAAEPVDAAAQAIAALSGGTCVVTLGGDGALACAPGATHRVAAMAVEVVDTTGAGDAFTGALAAALDAGHDLPAALIRASIAGGLACTALGAQASLPRQAEIVARVRER